MKLRDAIDVVLNEAESSALGENNQETMKAVTLLHDFLEWVADDIKIWDDSKSTNRFYGLVGWSIFTNANGIMCEDIGDG